MDTYKKKYEDALERAKKIVNNKYASLTWKDWLKNTFSELKESEDEKIRKDIISYIKAIANNENISPDSKKECKTWIDWLEKQGEQKQLYIRFGEIPTDEKSKIYRGEIEVGTENGVSVYPAFKTDEGDIVLGLSLPITKTTLYTQQHLIEYDDRPCYLVNGDYVGKDTDGQPLINNVSIIKKIDSYRIKEKKQGEQKSTIEMITPEESLGIDSETYNKIVDKCIYGEQKSADKVEPRFKVGDWIVDKSGFRQQVLDFRAGIYTCTYNSFTIDCESNYHLWTIQDAEEGDVIYLPNGNNEYYFFIFKGIENAAVMTFANFYQYNDGTSEVEGTINRLFSVNDVFQPATKEQRDLLFQKMKEEGYEWDAKKKELKKIEQNPAWSEEDENHVDSLLKRLKGLCRNEFATTRFAISEDEDWLKSLKQRIGG